MHKKKTRSKVTYGIDNNFYYLGSVDTEAAKGNLDFLKHNNIGKHLYYKKVQNKR